MFCDKDMASKTALLQTVFAHRREAEHKRIERTEAANKYFNHWDKVTARFQNWTAPDYYENAEKQLEEAKQQKEREKLLCERREKLAELLEMEKKKHDQEIQEKQNNTSRKVYSIDTLERLDEKLKERAQEKRKLELEAKLYSKWRYGVEDEHRIFESKSNNEVLAKLNWLDKQVDEQMQREKENEAAKERQLKLQQELNKSEELQNERQRIREKEIHEIRSMHQYHLQQLKELQKESDELKLKEKVLKDNLGELEKDLELMEDSRSALTHTADFSDAHNLNKIKLFIRKRSQVFHNHINLCLSISERTLAFAQQPDILINFTKHLKQQLQKETERVSQIEGMYESEAKYSLHRTEELWQQEHAERYKQLKKILMDEHHATNKILIELTKRQEELLEIRSTHLEVVGNSNKTLKLLIQEEEESMHYKSHDTPTQDGAKDHKFTARFQATSVTHNQLEESADTPLFLPRPCYYDQNKPMETTHATNEYNSSPNRISNSFNHLNLDFCQGNYSSQRDLESQKTNSQRSLQVVTPETEADRPRFGRKRVAWN